MKLKGYLAIATMVIIALAGLNAVIRLLGASFQMLDFFLVFLGFLGMLAIVYIKNEFKFKSKLDLALNGVITGVLLYLVLGVQALVSNLGPIYQIYQGFQPLALGLIVGGIVTIIVGSIQMKSK